LQEIYVDGHELRNICYCSLLLFLFGSILHDTNLQVVCTKRDARRKSYPLHQSQVK